MQLADGTLLAGFTAAEDGTVTLPAATLQALAAGDYTLYVTYAPLGVAYNARYEASEAPAMTSVALSVQKAEGSVAILDDVSRDYNGQPVETPAITSLGTGALTVEYRAQDGEFTTQAPKAVGSYTVRVTAAADDDYASASAQRNFRITAKSVTIDGVTVEPSKTYDGTTDATIVTGGTLSANFDGNDLRIVTGSERRHRQDRLLLRLLAGGRRRRKLHPGFPACRHHGGHHRPAGNGGGPAHSG